MSEEYINIGTLNIEMFADVDSYKMWKSDLGIWAFGIMYILIVVHSLGRGSYEDILYYVLFSIGFVYSMLMKRDELQVILNGTVAEKKVQNLQWYLMLANVIVVGIITAVGIFGLGLPFTRIEHNFVVATSEQLIYAVFIPNLCVKLFPYGFTIGEETSVLSYLMGTVISDGLFVLAHIYRYAGWGLAYVGAIGFLLHFTGYFNPSISIIFHFLLNTIAM